MLLSNRVAIITGSAKGMGKGIALKFAEEGCKVAIVDISLKDAKDTLAELLKIVDASTKGAKAAPAEVLKNGSNKAAKTGGGGMAIECDVTVEKQVHAAVDQVIQKWGKIDILINNAGGAGASYPIEEMSEETWDRVFALNLKSQFFFCKYVVPYLKAQKSGKIVNLSSIGAFQPPAHHIAYNSAKAAAIGFTNDLANALAPYNINVNALVPGPIRTSFYDGMIGQMTNDEKDAFFGRLGKKVPLQRAGTPEDIAGAALFLCSDLGAYVTGQAIYVTGGLPLLPPAQPTK
ncbi:MAG TPA: SDR family NAD(P)-dependent oxidoreductase [Dehalococcoidales bacterium]